MVYYTSLNTFLKKKYGEKVYKLALSSSNTCPNRDGTLGVGGCIFCSEGSGDFAESPLLSIDEQIENAKRRILKKTDAKKFIAYFQSYTSTYAPLDVLEEMFMGAVKRDDILELSVATRPDCLGEDVLELLTRASKIKPVTVELGLQTIHESTSKLINRKSELKSFDDAIRKLKSLGISVVMHVILGLPRETEEMMLKTVQYVVDMKVDGIKLQLLHILKGTKLEEMYNEGLVTPLEKDEYFKILEKCLKIIPKEMVVHRLTGDGARKKLIAPLWTLDKKDVINSLKFFCLPYDD